MRTALFLKTYAGDHEWLPYCLRSIQKFCSGYSGVHVVSEDDSVRPVVEQFQFAFHPVLRPNYSGYLQQQVVKMQADRFLRPDDEYVVFIDTDAIFDSPNSPGTWFIEGKPRLVVNTYEFLRNAGAYVPWQSSTQRYLKFSCPFETMRLQPLIHRVDTVRATREHVERVNKSTLEGIVRGIRHPWGTFSEFNIIGSFAMRHHRSLYHVVNYDNGYYKLPSAQQFGFYGEGRRVLPGRAAVLSALLA